MNTVDTGDADKIPLQFRYFHFISILFVISFILSNLLATKIATVGIFDFPAGMVTFPLSYIFGDILTEVYGFQRTRQLLWFTIFCELFVLIAIILAVLLPPARFWHSQPQYQAIFLPQIKIIFASCISYFLGDFVNNKFLTKMKLKCGNKFIAARFIGSTAIGVLVDNTIFTLLVFFTVFMSGEVKAPQLYWLIISQYFIKVSYETLMAPFSVKFCTWLKNQEQVDIYDLKTDFAIFKFSVDESQHINKYSVT